MVNRRVLILRRRWEIFQCKVSVKEESLWARTTSLAGKTANSDSDLVSSSIIEGAMERKLFSCLKSQARSHESRLEQFVVENGSF